MSYIYIAIDTSGDTQDEDIIMLHAFRDKTKLLKNEVYEDDDGNPITVKRLVEEGWAKVIRLKVV